VQVLLCSTKGSEKNPRPECRLPEKYNQFFFAAMLTPAKNFTNFLSNPFSFNWQTKTNQPTNYQTN